VEGAEPISQKTPLERFSTGGPIRWQRGAAPSARFTRIAPDAVSAIHMRRDDPGSGIDFDEAGAELIASPFFTSQAP
jgi:hypothetical protein